MSDSLLLGGIIELLGRVPSAQPQCAGATFILAPGFDLSAPQPTSDVVASLIVDGQRPFGNRAGNRTLTLPVLVTGPDRATVAAAVELLLRTINQQVWQMTWTRDGASAAVFDCFRATPTVMTYNLLNQYDDLPLQALTVSFPALPYVRADEASVVTFSSPASGTEPAAAPVELDNYAAVAGAGWSQSSVHVDDAHSAHWASSGGGFPTYARAIPTTDISQQAAVSVWVGLGATADGYLTWNGGPVTVSLTLTDSNGAQLVAGATAVCAASESTAAPVWQQVTMPLPSSDVFDFTAVISYSVSVWAFRQAGALVLPADLYVNGLTAVPSSVSVAASTRAWLAALPAIQGSAHAPLGLQLQMPGSAEVVSQHTTAGSYSVVIPSTTDVDYELWGGGGGGKSLTSAGQGGGASGGGYAQGRLTLAAGTYTGSVGSGGAAGANGGATTFDGKSASGGLGATSSAGAAPNDTSTSPVHYPGGAGASGTPAAGAASRRQVAQGTAGASGPFDIVFPNTTLAGSCIVLWVGTFGSTTAPVVEAVQLYTDSDNWQEVINTGNLFGWIDPDCEAGHTDVHISIGEGSGAIHVIAWAEEWVNVTASPLDQPVSDETAGTTFASGSTPLTAQADELWVAAAWASATSGSPMTLSPTGSWTNDTEQQRGADNRSALITGHQIVTATGTPFYSGNAGSNAKETAAAVITLRSSAPAYGGGGGSSAGTGGDGGDALGAAGGMPPTGGGQGGNGEIAAGPGANGVAPGGGGAGALSTGASESGGAGANGQAIISYQAEGLAQFSDFIAHVPGLAAPAALVPYVNVGNGADTPNGLTEYAVAGPATGINARFGGTYAVLAVAETLDTPTTSRTITVTIKEYEYSGGPSVQTAVSRTLTPSDGDDVTSGLNGYVMLGTVTLPNRYVDPDNTASYFTVTMTDDHTADRWLDVLFLDVTGQTALVNIDGDGYTTYYIDVPDTSQDVGPVLGSQSGRSQAASVLADAILSGGPLYVDPGVNTLMVYSSGGAPSLVATYRPQFWIDRTD